ncbi:MAG: GntR family transcriptional regulator [Lachnospiraceae bacterium]|nr:GntR family transcriptional regulator [Lachnospiraceae bacterium]
MQWELKSDRPIYTQILEEMKKRIVSGYYKPGEKLLAVRELAQEARVNPNTMQKAMTELERENLVYTMRTTGRYITEDTDLIDETKKELAQSHVAYFYKQLEALGYQKKEMIELLKLYEEDKG